MNARPRLALLAAACLALAAPLPSLGHGNHAAMHGGIVKAMGETILELVVEGDGTRVYLRDEVEGTPLAVSGGKLISLRDGAKAESSLVADGNGRLLAKGLKLPPGTRVSVQVVLADGVTRVATNFAIP